MLTERIAYVSRWMALLNKVLKEKKTAAKPAKIESIINGYILLAKEIMTNRRIILIKINYSDKEIITSYNEWYIC